MNGYKGFRHILWFLMGQGLMLGVMFVLGAGLVGLLLSASAVPMPWTAVGYMVGASAVLLMLNLVWPILLEPVELLWGTSAKVRAKRWLQPALLISAALSAVAVPLTAAHALSPILTYLAFASVLLSIGVCGALTGLLLVSALRRFRAYTGGLTLMTEALGDIANDDQSRERIAASIATERGTFTTTVRANPQGFTFAGLSSKPWHDPEDFAWVADFEENVDAITEEAKAVLNLHTDKVEMYPYVGLEGNFWKSFSFASRHRENADNTGVCPVTDRLLRTVPGYPSFRDAMFSILEPGAIISPHRDVSNIFLTMHLPLIVPEGGFMEVGGLRRPWRRGEAMIFDSSYNHQAVNSTEGVRVVLLVDFLHPELTLVEREFVARVGL